MQIVCEKETKRCDALAELARFSITLVRKKHSKQFKCRAGRAPPENHLVSFERSAKRREKVVRVLHSTISVKFLYILCEIKPIIRLSHARSW